jgi:hypothetical protein
MERSLMFERGWFEKQLQEVALERKNWPEWLKEARGIDAEGVPIRSYNKQAGSTSVGDVAFRGS